MRTLFSALLIFVLLFGGVVETMAQEDCAPERLEIVIDTLQAARAAMSSGDQARAVELLTAVQTSLDPIIAACSGAQTVEVEDATPEAVVTSGETVVIESDLTLPNTFVASGDLFAFSMPEGYTYEESSTSYESGTAITVRLEPSSGSDLPNNVATFNVLIGDPFAIADWVGVFDAEALTVGFEGIGSIARALENMVTDEDVQLSNALTYRIDLAGHAGAAVSFDVVIDSDTPPLEAVVYIVDYGDGVYGAYAALALEGGMGAQVEVLNAMALSMQLGE